MTNEAVFHWKHWYEVVETTNLRQGDILRDLVVYWLPEDLHPPENDPHDREEVRVPAEGRRDDWIVLTASCDLDQGRCPQILLARIYTLSKEVLKAQNTKEYNERCEVLRRGYFPSRFLLAEFPEIDPPFRESLVEFRHHFTMPIDYVRRACKGPRLRMMHPIREQFGNWVGSCLSAVGPENEANIPPFKERIFDAQKLRAVDSLLESEE